MRNRGGATRGSRGGHDSRRGGGSQTRNVNRNIPDSGDRNNNRENNRGHGGRDNRSGGDNNRRQAMGHGGRDNRSGGGSARDNGRRAPGGYQNKQGGGKGGRPRGAGAPELAKFSEECNTGFNGEVTQLNASDNKGPMFVMSFPVLDEGGNKTPYKFVESLSKGTFYVQEEESKSVSFNPRKAFAQGDKTWEGFPDNPRKGNPDWEYANPSYAERPPNHNWTDNEQKLQVVTNIFNVKSTIGELVIYRYRVDFDKYEPKEVDARSNVFHPRDRKEKMAIHETLRKEFGCWAFDNLILYCFGKSRKELKPQIDLKFEANGNIHVLTFVQLDNEILMGETGTEESFFPAQQQELLLNVFKRAKVESAGFVCLRRQFFKKRGHEDAKVIRNFRLRFGYDCAIRLNENQQPVFAVDMCCRLLHDTSIWQQIQNIAEDANPERNQDAFRRLVRQKLIGRAFIPKYNTRNYKIEDIDFNLSESHTFEKNGVPVMFKDYIKNTYGLKTTKKEICMLVDEEGHKFISQHCFLTARSSEAKAVYKEILDELGCAMERRLERVTDFVSVVNRGDVEAYNAKVERSGFALEQTDIHIEDRAIETEAVVLKPPKIHFEGKRGKQEHGTVDNFRWSNTGGIRNQLQINNWAIVYTQRRQERDAKSVRKHFDTYLKMRKFELGKNGPFDSAPNIIHLNCKLKTKEDYAQISQMIPEGTEAIILVLDDGDDGGRVKVQVTNALQRATVRDKKPVILQCVRQRNCKNKNAVLGSFEDLLGKLEAELFMIEPQLSENCPIDLDRVWTMGLATTRIDNKTVSNVCLNTKPFTSSLLGKTFKCNININKVTIMPFNNAFTVYAQLLTHACQQLIDNDQTNALPTQLFFFRDGVPDSQVREMHSKEVQSLSRAIRHVTETLKLKWKPKINFMVFQTRIRDKFGEINHKKHGKIEKPSKACAIYQRLPSSRFWDFVVYPNAKSKYGKPVRWMVLVDGCKLAQTSPMDLLNFVYALHWTYGFAIPFPQGCCSVPNEIQLAKKYAELYARSILGTDESIRDTKISNKLFSRACPIETAMKPTRFEPESQFKQQTSEATETTI